MDFSLAIGNDRERERERDRAREIDSIERTLYQKTTHQIQQRAGLHHVLASVLHIRHLLVATPIQQQSDFVKRERDKCKSYTF